MSVNIEHWLFKTVRYNIHVERETECRKCVHFRVCAHEMSTFCRNFEFGISEGTNCSQCTHKYTRWSNDSIPCFCCAHFRSQDADDDQRWSAVMRRKQ